MKRDHVTRRRLVFAFGAVAGAWSIGLRSESAPSSRMSAAVQKVIGDVELRQGRVKLDVPPLIDNGNAVPLAVSVDSPMTATDHVRAIHVFTEKNPQPNVFSMFLGPRAGRASVSTRIRLADTQSIIAIAELSDGSFWSASVAVVVTLAACLEELT